MFRHASKWSIILEVLPTTLLMRAKAVKNDPGEMPSSKRFTGKSPVHKMPGDPGTKTLVRKILVQKGLQ